MIHHLSIAAENPRHVADVLAELFGGKVTGFGPHPDSYIAWAGDEHGSAIEVYPRGVEMFPAAGSGQAQFRHNPSASGYLATHAAVSLTRQADEIYAVAKREGWRALELSRGSFRVIEFWIENHVMLELLTPAMAQEYLQATGALRRA